ncbi:MULTISPECIES: hypothetical protein [unclassified Saccharopolyspora]|uniref:hypothetical protein n=1 Tax=unclassified Saccharopolyspora TaxID=2646250 RepID=UPI001CD37E9A|nr:MULTISPECIES: hypothetical protein [unclassified Saccharopolyspora]MCA1189292.1 hypothetical protein [Saccharopolyspora sp. 6T]MCA1194001.1 hypothetical protein [Saccharopolyspora sp. 6V]MCA1229647.1 hypothetical protein [Saccharopolyspora sp. 6M]MCA1279270.1 hypothetical protein [Saccharopolyspora sp. 7B]
MSSVAVWAVLLVEFAVVFGLAIALVRWSRGRSAGRSGEAERGASAARAECR